MFNLLKVMANLFYEMPFTIQKLAINVYGNFCIQLMQLTVSYYVHGGFSHYLVMITKQFVICTCSKSQNFREPTSHCQP